jgi:hypothetical protein
MNGVLRRPRRTTYVKNESSSAEQKEHVELAVEWWKTAEMYSKVMPEDDIPWEDLEP